MSVRFVFLLLAGFLLVQSSFQMALPNAVLGESKDSGVEENHSLSKVEDTKGFVTDENEAVEGATEESETNALEAETYAPEEENQNVEGASAESQTDDENANFEFHLIDEVEETEEAEEAEENTSEVPETNPVEGQDNDDVKIKNSLNVVVEENENQEEDTENQHTESPDTESQDTDNQDTENQDIENQDTDNQNTEFSVTEDLKEQAFQLEEIANKRLKYAKELLENLEFEYNFKARDLKEELEHYRGAKGKNPFETMRLADEIDLVLRDYTSNEEFEQYKQQFYERFYDGVMESYSSHEDTINGRVAPLPTRKTCELDYVNKSVSCVL